MRDTRNCVAIVGCTVAEATERTENSKTSSDNKGSCGDLDYGYYPVLTAPNAGQVTAVQLAVRT